MATDPLSGWRRSFLFFVFVFVLQTFTGNIPFEHQRRDATVVIEVTLGIRPPRPGVGATARGLSDTVWSLIEACWQADDRKRPRVPAILAALEEANRLYIPQSSLSSYSASTEFKSIIAERDGSDYESDSDDGRFFNRGRSCYFTKFHTNLLILFGW